MNYYDILLAKKLEDDRDPQVVGLSVTENGTYSEEGKVYKPVVVNVPLGSKSITANGTYNATSDNLKGFSSVDVHVSGYKITDVSGLPSAIATFSDGANLPMPKLEVAIEPVQEGSGDPSPENIRPISGWTEANVSVSGKNLFDKTSVEINKRVNASGIVESANSYFCSDYISVKKNTPYYFTNLVSSGYYYTMAFFDSNKQFVRSENIYGASQIISGEKTFDIDGYVIINSYTSALDTVQVTFGETAPTEYTPYNGHTYTIDLDGTRYGGKVDLVSGVLTVDRKYTNLPAHWELNAQVTDYWLINSITISGLPSVTNSDTEIRVISDMFKGVSASTILGSDVSNSIAVISSNRLLMRIKKSEFATISDFETWISNNNPKILYELATPTTIQLTPTAVKSLLGINNLSADTGDVVEASYWEEL